MQRAQIGIIGGSGLYDMADVTEREEVKITTPFGEPSAAYRRIMCPMRRVRL